MKTQASIQKTLEQFRADGFVLVPNLVSRDALVRLNESARRQLHQRLPPLEWEADLQYPGAPRSRQDAGGDTVRRLLDAYGRDPEFASWAAAPRVCEWMRAYFTDALAMSRVHHNCLMTKHPRYGSMTGWHRDIRFWSFQREDLVSSWIALGEERIDNGALWFIPGSHRMDLGAARFDDGKFFRGDTPDGEALVQAAQPIRLAPGDAVFFHCNTLHSAGQNRTEDIKFSLVYTYHGIGNRPLRGSRSATKPEVLFNRTPA